MTVQAAVEESILTQEAESLRAEVGTGRINHDFTLTDSLGPIQISHLYDPMTGLKAIVVVDNIACGPAIGGVRMATDVTTSEVARLARAMTLKNAISGLPHGGGKAAILADPKVPLPEKETLVRTFAQAIQRITDYVPGPDMGTNELCMAWVKEEMGRAIGLPSAIGGIPIDEIGATGYGVSIAAELAGSFLGIDLAGATLVIQGLGSVGKHTARFLQEKGVILVGASDSQGTVFNLTGLDISQLIAWKESGQSLREFPDGKGLDREAVVYIPCDIWVPAARPDVIHGGNIDRLKTKLIVQGANIPLTAEAEQICHDRNILVIPDFIANAGGVIAGSVEYHGGTQNDALEAIADTVSRNTQKVLEIVEQTHQLPRQVATNLALKRIRAMMDDPSLLPSI